MIVNLIKEKQMFSLTLPRKVKGQYWLNDFDDKGNLRQLISVEAIDDRWYVKSNKKVSILDGNSTIEKYELTKNNFLHLRLYDSNEKVVLFTEDIDETRHTLSKLVVTEASVFTIGRAEDNNFCYNNNYVSTYHAQLAYDGEEWAVTDQGSRNGTYVNGYNVKSKKLKPGDYIYIMGLKIVIGGGYIAVNNPDLNLKIKTGNLALYSSEKVKVRTDKEELPEKTYFLRAPRFHREVESETIKIDPPPQLEKIDSVPLALMLGPSLTMAMTSVSTALLSVNNILSRGGEISQALPSIIMSVSMLLGTILWPILTKKYEKKQKIKNEKNRQDKYLSYLNEISDQIKSIAKKQADIISENLVPQEECIERIVRNKPNLWERVAGQKDFLRIRLGIGTVPMELDVNYQEKKFTMEDDSLQNAMLSLAEEPKQLVNVPISVSLKDNRVVGIYGEQDAYNNMLKSMLLQMVSLHSYDELKVILLIDESEEENWSFAKYIPHLWDDAKNIRFYASTLDDVKELSAFMEKEILSRQKGERKLEESEIIPHYVCIATSKALRKKCAALQQLIAIKNNIGFTTIFTGNNFNDFPKETKIIIHANGKKSVVFDKEDTTGKQEEFIADITNESLFDNISEKISNIELDLSSQNYVLPNRLTFLEMFNVGKVEHLNSLTRWKENNPTKTLQTPVGVGVDGDTFMIDLHEKYHGPHGLIAGMTGSGKSEFIITYILSLAVNYHPDEVAFILIDYKGGGLTGAFENEDKGIKLPHLVGTITNLDGAAITRSLVSIQSELRRRQAIFNEARRISNEGTMDIYKYQQLYREKIVAEPLPHLFIISDEFAELKTQQPEFMEQLISAARIGRSLGVHLILATQKPSGVVDDQIWSNSRFRVCLKVQEKADSQDMIKCPDAAELAQTGRFYLQVGFNELFALGQSAWCGAEYFPTDVIEKEVDNSVQVVDRLGRIIMNISPEKKAIFSSKTKQVVSIVEYLSDLAVDEGVNPRALWLDPIPEHIYLEQIEEKYNVKSGGTILAPVVGEYDDPYNQRQGVLQIPLTDGGNCAVYGATGNGKTTFLTTLCYALLKNHTAEELNLYIMDFGSETLKAFEKAPQVGGVITSVDEEKNYNLFKMLRKELEYRRNLFSEYGGDYMSYCKNSGNIIPNIVIVINNYSGFAEQYEDLQEEFAMLSRDCVKYGMYFVVSAGGVNAIRYKVQQNFKTMLTLQLNDATDYTIIVGKTEGVLPSKYKGRGLVALDKVYEFQTAYCTDAEDMQAHIRMFAKSLREEASHYAKAIPILPDVVDYGFVENAFTGLSFVPAGVTKDSLEIVGVNLEKSVTLPILAYDIQDLVPVCTELAYMLSNKVKTVVIDTERLLSGCAGDYIDKDFATVVKEIFDEMVIRNNTYKDANMDQKVLNDKEEIVYVLFGVKKLFEQLDADSKDKLSILLEKAEAIYKIHFVMCDISSQMNTMSYEAWYKRHVSSADGVWVGEGVADQFIFKINKVTSAMYQEIGAGYGYLISRGKPSLVKVLSNKNSKGD